MHIWKILIFSTLLFWFGLGWASRLVHPRFSEYVGAWRDQGVERSVSMGGFPDAVG